MAERNTNSRRLLWASLICVASLPVGHTAVSVPLSGAIGGTVRSPGGVPQMGAQVTLYNHLQKPLGKVFTDEHGEFKLLGLVPALYSIKISFAAFVPATRQVLVQPGMRSMLNVNLSTLFSNIQFGYPSPDNGIIMTDEWKWVLRSAPATRPVLQYLGTNSATPAHDGNSADADAPSSTVASTSRHAAVFSETRGLFHVSAGDAALNEGVSSQADLGATFALATQLYGSGMVQVSGNLGYAMATGAPATAFRTSYSREIAGGNPEVSLTLRQLMLPRITALATPDGSGLSQLRSMTAGLRDENRISESLTLQYGITMDEVSFLDHLNYYSPYARLIYTVDPNNQFLFGYSSGDARPNLDNDAAGTDDPLRRDVDALGALPRMSLLDNRTQIQRGVEYEAVYVRKSGSRTYKAFIYRQDISNTAITMAAPSNFFSGGDVLPDLFSNSYILNAGTFQSTGVALSATQNLGDNAGVTVIYGDAGVLTAPPDELVSHSPDELRAMIHEGRRQQLTTRVSATAPRWGTHLVASYQWTGEQRAIMAGNLYSMNGMQALPGLNVYLRQPLPGFGGHLEATADLRNLIAQGYLPLNAAGGQRILLVQNPRTLRGGLNFRF